jgi:hypothetical protein
MDSRRINFVSAKGAGRGMLDSTEQALLAEHMAACCSDRLEEHLEAQRALEVRDV